MERIKCAGLVAFGLCLACGGAPGDGGPDPQASKADDTICGLLWTVGREPDLLVDLELETGLRVRLEGGASRSLVPLAGVEACVETEPSTKRVRTVRSFVVRRVGGEPALDGTLVERDSAYYLRTGDGKEVTLSRVFGPLRLEVGRRIWVVIDDSSRVKAAGVIQ